MGGILRATFGKCAANSEISWAVYTPDSHQQSTDPEYRRFWYHVLVQRLQRQQQEEAHKAIGSRVSSTVLHAYLTFPFRKDKVLRHIEQQAKGSA